MDHLVDIAYNCRDVHLRQIVRRGPTHRSGIPPGTIDIYTVAKKVIDEKDAALRITRWYRRERARRLQAARLRLARAAAVVYFSPTFGFSSGRRFIRKPGRGFTRAMARIAAARADFE